jgi:hypothetical protein
LPKTLNLITKVIRLHITIKTVMEEVTNNRIAITTKVTTIINTKDSRVTITPVVNLTNAATPALKGGPIKTTYTDGQTTSVIGTSVRIMDRIKVATSASNKTPVTIATDLKKRSKSRK